MGERVDARHLFDSFAYTLWPSSRRGATCSGRRAAAARTPAGLTAWQLPAGN